MPSTYRTARKKIADALTNKIKLLNGNHPYNTNVSGNVSSKLTFIDEIEQYPKVCVGSRCRIKRVPTRRI